MGAVLQRPFLFLVVSAEHSLASHVHVSAECRHVRAGDGAGGIPDGAQEQLRAAPHHRAQCGDGELEERADAVAAQRTLRVLCGPQGRARQEVCHRSGQPPVQCAGHHLRVHHARSCQAVQGDMALVVLTS